MSQSIPRNAPRDWGYPRLAVILLATAQVVAAAMPSFGIGTPIGERSDAFRTLITPAGWAFAIWGVLYAGSFAFAAYQALASQKDNRFLAVLRWPAAGAFLGNALWATYVELFDLSMISVGVILFTLGCLLTGFRHIAGWQGRLSVADRWCAAVPISALAAWLSAATIVNLAASLRFHGIEADSATAPIVSAGVIALGGAIAGVALARSRGNPAFALVFFWALAGVYGAGGQVSRLVAIGAIVAALLTLGGAAFGLRRAAVVRAKP